jgi:hypothetical protein
MADDLKIFNGNRGGTTFHTEPFAQLLPYLPQRLAGHFTLYQQHFARGSGPPGNGRNQPPRAMS